MTKSCLLLLLWCVAIECRANIVEYDVNLDAPPRERYNHIVKDFLDPINELHKEMMAQIKPIVQSVMATLYHTVIMTFYREYAEEISGLAAATNKSDVDIFIMNCIYELRTLCTSIVARDSKGKAMLARNLDYVFANLLRRIQVLVHYKSRGVEVCRCAGMAGLIGFMTCMKPNAFAVSLNARRLGSEVDMLKAFFLGRPPVTWMIRHTFLTANTFAEAVDQLSKADSVSGSYLTVAGTGANEGAVITRARENALDVLKLNSSAWYLAQCNSDHWNGTDIRTTMAHEWMDAIGPTAVALDKIASDVLFRPPILQQSTIITALMSPIDNYTKVIIQDPTLLPPSDDLEFGAE